MDYKLAGEKFAELLETMGRLRSRNGCPWDKEQTHGSLKQFLLEESHELLDVLTEKTRQKSARSWATFCIRLFFTVKSLPRAGRSPPQTSLRELNNKIVRRHPHVFSGQALPDSAAVIKQWSEIKARENSEGMKQSALGNLPKTMPALTRAQKIKRASFLRRL